MPARPFIDQLIQSFSEHSAKTALCFWRQNNLETELSYGELDQYSKRIGDYLIDRGVSKGDRVLICIPKCPALVLVHLSVLRIGAIAVPLNDGFTESELTYLVKDADASLVVAGPKQAELIERIEGHSEIIVIEPWQPIREFIATCGCPDVSPEMTIVPDDPALIIYTSGTTGDPKGAVLTQANLLSDAEAIINFWEIKPEDGVCHALPLFHIHGLCFALHTSLLSGCRIMMQDTFSPAQTMALLTYDEGPWLCTIFMGVPAIYSKLLDYLGENKPKVSHLRLLTSGSAPLLPKDFQRIADVFGLEPVEREGMSETGMNFSNPLVGIRKPGSIGVALPSVQVRLVDPTTLTDVSRGETGEFWLKSAAITSGYWRKPKETGETFSDGWFRTGDLGYVDDEAYYYLEDRIKHIIISGGENISPKEIESVINRMEAIKESAVVGVADETWGEKVVAAVVTKPGCTVSTDDIKKFCQQNLHKWKCPKKFMIVKELPRNTMGKVLKEKIQLFWE